jgi:predicted tellurium resistance membrane protein TerC
MGSMDGDLIGLFALLVGLELILGVDNVLVIAILVSRLPENKRNSTRNFGLVLAMVARVIMVLGGLKLIQLTNPVWTNGPDWFAYSWRDLALLGGGLFLMWKAVKEIHATVELEHHETKNKAKASLGGIIFQIVILDIVFSLDSVITAVGLTNNQWIIITAVLSSFVVILFFAKPIGDFIMKNVALKILALSFLIVIGITIFMEGLGKEVEKSMIYVPMGFALAIQLLQMRHKKNLNQIKNKTS